MTRSKRRVREKRKFETAGVWVLGRARVGRAPAATRLSVHRLRGLLVCVLIVVLAGALWLALDDRFYIYHADVVGAVRVSANDVFRASGLPGLHVLWMRSADCETRLLAALPTLESAHVACRLPAKCTISVVERQPRLLWDDDGQFWWVDAEGVIFPGEAPAQDMPADRWLIKGPLPHGEDGGLDGRVRVALAELWVAGANVSSVLYYVPGRGLVVTDERGWRVIVGQGSGMDERLRVLESLAAALQARGLTPRFVDVRFTDAPYYSLTNDW
jgi:cell division septal protein FtsQ